MAVIADVETLEKELAEVPEDEENQPQRDEIQAKIDAIAGGSNVGTKACPKASYELVEMEEQVLIDGGCWLRFMKLPPMADGGDAGKKAPPKGKAGGEDLKPTFGKAWVDFKELMKAGTTEFNQRVFL